MAMTRPLAGVLALTTLASFGCAQPMGMVAFHFNLQATTEQGRGLVPAATRATGSLTVSFQELVASKKARTLLAKVADVDHVTIRLTPTAAGGPDITKVIDHAMLLGGTASWTFDHLPLGHIDIVVLAQDSAGAVLGSASSYANLADATAVTVPVQVVLDPTIVAAPTPAPTLPGGGGPPPVEGNLAVGFTLADGLEVWPTTGAGTYTFADGADFVCHDHDVTWVAPHGGKIARYAADGTLLGTTDLGEEICGRPDFDSAGNAWIPCHGPVFKVSPAGAILAQYGPIMSFVKGCAVDSQGAVWVTNEVSNVLTKVGNDAVEIFSVDLGGGFGNVPARVAVDKFDRAWVTDHQGTLVSLVTTAGAKQSTIPMPANYFISDLALDSSGDCWTIDSGTQAVKVDHGSLAVQTINTGYPNKKLRIDSQGDLWILQGPVSTSVTGETDVLARFASDGTLKGRYQVAPFAALGDFDFNANGEVWVSNLTRSELLHITF